MANYNFFQWNTVWYGLKWKCCILYKPGSSLSYNNPILVVCNVVCGVSIQFFYSYRASFTCFEGVNEGSTGHISLISFVFSPACTKPILLKRLGCFGGSYMSKHLRLPISENKQYLETEVVCGSKPQVACIQWFSTNCILRTAYLSSEG